MENTLRAIMDVAGVGAALVGDGSGRLVAHRGHAIYDQELCGRLAGILVRVVDAVQLQQEDWETLNARFADGRLLVRNLGAGYVLGVVGDATLNPSFAMVALRVAANKLRRILGDGAASSVVLLPAADAPAPAPAPPAVPSTHGPGVPPPLPPPAKGEASPPARPASSAPAESSLAPASTGVSWGAGSSVGLSRIAIADSAAGAFLVRCAKELARHVGPMSKVYVEEAARRVAPGAPFSLELAARLVDDLAAQIDDAGDRAQFRKALES